MTGDRTARLARMTFFKRVVSGGARLKPRVVDGARVRHGHGRGYFTRTRGK